MKTKIKVANLEKVNFALLRKEFLRISAAMKSEETPGGDSPETAIPFFVKKDHTFACGTEHPLFVLAAKNPAWKKQAKEAFNYDKKGMFFGKCYIMDGTLYVQIQKGNMKMVDLKKSSKMLLKKGGIINVGICQGVVKKKDNTSSSTSQETTSTTSTVDTKQDTKTQPQDPEQQKQKAKKEAQKAKGRETMDKMFLNLQKWAKALRIS